MKNRRVSHSSFTKYVADYYNSTINLYLLWSKDHFHYGIWDETTKSLDEAMMNTTRLVADCLEINKGDVVLDAGCGVGGSSRYIASKYGVKTVGITISGEQAKKARELSRNAENASLLEFYRQDYTCTDFPDGSFTKIFAIESACHAPDKGELAREVYRLLKTGGKFVIADAFQFRSDLSEKEQKAFAGFLDGWELASINSIQDYFDKLHQVGFQNVSFQDKTLAVAKTSWIVHSRAKRFFPISWMLAKLRLIPESWHRSVIAAYHQRIFLDNNIARYGFILAEK